MKFSVRLWVRCVFCLALASLGVANVLARSASGPIPRSEPAEGHSLKVTILSTMLADAGIGLNRHTCVIGTDGATFDLQSNVYTGSIA